MVISWISVALAAYLFLAVANLFDKFLIDHIIGSARAYTFFACIMGAIVILASPWLLKWPGWFYFIVNIALGGVFVLALWSLYEALKRGEAARILVLVGGTTPIFSIILSMAFLKECFSVSQWFGLAFLLLGVFIIAFLPTHRSFLSRLLRHLKIKQIVGANGLWLAIFSGLAYSIYFVGSKYAFSHQAFASAFIWNRLGAALFALLFLLKAGSRCEIKKFARKSSPSKHKFLVVLGQGLGSLGFILQNYAVSLGSVALINALQGVQYAFILVISTILALSLPRLLKETFSWRILLQKTAAVTMVGIGLYFIAF